MSSYWGYDFHCDQSIDAILADLNAAGPWQWQMRDSDFYGAYLNCRPLEGVRVRIVEDTQDWRATSLARPGDFSASLECGDTETQSEIDRIFRRLLQKIHATKVTGT